MRRASSLSVVAAVLAVMILGPSAHAQSICESMKVKASGKMFSCLTNAYAKAYKGGTSVLPEVVTKCETKFAASCAKGVLRGDCGPVTRDCLDLARDISRHGGLFTRDGCVTAPSGLVAWWPLDEQEGNIARDISSELTVLEDVGNDGIRAAGSVPVIGKHSLGMSGRVNAPALHSHNATNLTVDAWVHDSDGTVLLFGDGVNGYEFLISSGNLNFFEQCSGTQKSYVALASIPSGVWTHVAFVADMAADAMTFYVNGVAQATSPSAYIASGSTLLDCAGLTNTAWDIGGVSGFDGIDEVEVFESALPQTEIDAIRSFGKGKCKPPCS